MTQNPLSLQGSLPIEDVAAFFADGATHRSYPVVDGDGRLLGLVSRSDVLNWHVAGAPRGASLADVLSDASQPLGLINTPIGEVADLMIESGVGRIPIVDAPSKRVVGILIRQDLLKGAPCQDQIGKGTQPLNVPRLVRRPCFHCRL